MQSINFIGFYGIYIIQSIRFQNYFYNNKIDDDEYDVMKKITSLATDPKDWHLFAIRVQHGRLSAILFDVARGWRWLGRPLRLVLLLRLLLKPRLATRRQAFALGVPLLATFAEATRGRAQPAHC